MDKILGSMNKNGISKLWKHDHMQNSIGKIKSGPHSMQTNSNVKCYTEKNKNISYLYTNYQLNFDKMNKGENVE